MRCRWKAVRASCLFKETRPPTGTLLFKQGTALKRHQDPLPGTER